MMSGIKVQSGMATRVRQCSDLKGVRQGRLCAAPFYRNRRQRCGLDSLRPRAAASPSPDPYKVLGVSKKTSSDNVQRAYRKKLQEAKTAGDQELVSTIEQAHSAIMMQELTQRMQGKESVSQDIAYADKAVYFPWRPRYFVADKKLTLISVVIQLALLVYALAVGETTGTQPGVAVAALICACIVYFKLEKLFPSGGGFAFSADPNERKQGGKNLFRCVIVALMGTATGIVLFFTLPDLFSNVILHKPLPYWVYDYQDSILIAGTVFMNLIMSIFFR